MFHNLYIKLLNTTKNSLLVRNTIFNYLINIFIYFFSFLSTPLLLAYLDKVNFGIYQTILMFLTWASLCNLGIGNGLRNKVSEYVALNEFEKLKKTLGSAFYIASIVVMVVISIGALFFLFIFDPQWLFNDTLTNIKDVKIAFFVTFLFFAFNFITGLFCSICLGLQKSYLATFAQLLNISVFCLLVFSILILGIPSKVSNIAICYGVAMVLSNAVPFFFVRQNHKIWPPSYSRNENKSETKNLLNTSFGFFFLQISTLFLFCSDNFIIAKMLGSKQVTEYSIANKLFFFIIGIFSIILVQVWNSITHAKAQNNHIWIRRIVLKLHLCLVPVFLVSMIICVFFDNITQFWLGTVFDLKTGFLFLCALYTIFHCLNAIYVNVLNGLSRIKWQMISYVFAGLLNIVLAYVFVRNLDMGITGVILSKTICIIFTSFVCFCDYKYLDKKNNNI